MPAVSLVGKPVIVSVFAAAACTAIPDSVPVMLDVTVSVAVIDCVPAVSSVTEKLCVPASARGERVARRQDGVRVAAGQRHRAGVAGRHVAIRVVGRDRDVTGRAGRVAGGEAGDRQRLGRGRLTAMPDSVPVRLDVTVSVAVIDCVPAVSSVTEKLCLPASAAVNV